MEHVVGPMPPMGAIVPTDDDLWKIITFIRSNYTVPRSGKFGCPVMLRLQRVNKNTRRNPSFSS